MNESDSKRTETPPVTPTNVSVPVHSMVFAALTLIGLYLCWRLALPFLPALAWALALAVLFSPVQRWLESRIKHPNAATMISVIGIVLIVVVPAAFVVNRLIVEIAKGAEIIQRYASSGELLKTLENQPLLSPLIQWVEREANLPELFGRIATWLTNLTASFVRGSVMQLVVLLLTFYLLFYFLRDRRQALASLRDLFPLTHAEMDRFFTRVVDTIHATVYGTLAVAAIQGALLGLMFGFLGLPAPLLWGLIMAMMAIIPFLGASIIWVPAAIWLASQGLWGKALILTVWGGGIVAVIDNLIYPILVGNRLQQHTVLAFISLVGGLLVFDAAGLILGPLSMTLTFLLLEIWHDRKPAP